MSLRLPIRCRLESRIFCSYPARSASLKESLRTVLRMTRSHNLSQRAVSSGRPCCVWSRVVLCLGQHPEEGAAYGIGLSLSEQTEFYFGDRLRKRRTPQHDLRTGLRFWAAFRRAE